MNKSILIALFLFGCNSGNVYTSEPGAGGAQSCDNKACNYVDPNEEDMDICYQEGAETYSEAKQCVRAKRGLGGFGGSENY